MYSNIPEELKVLNQWVCWRLIPVAGKKPTKMLYNPHTGEAADSTNRNTWVSFEEAVSNAHDYDGIGFVFSKDDPYCGIDLDDAWELKPDGTPKYDDPEATHAVQVKIFDAFKSYAEISPGGKGLHIITKGDTEVGRRRNGTELYSKERFFTMTGNVYRDAPIINEQSTVTALFNEMGKSVNHNFYDGNAPQREEDQAIINRALNAANGDKFKDLLAGNWQGAYPSQSEADLSYINMLAFYTQNREQITRIFQLSPLGFRNKQTSIRGVKYLDHMINRSFDRMLPPIDIEGLRNQMELVIAQAKAKAEKGVADNVPMPPTDLPTPTPAPEAVEEIEQVEAAPFVGDGDVGPYTVPPGLLGDIAQYIYAAAPRPVPEIALAGALAFMAGVCGRAFNVNGTGLNQYFLLLAPTGTGKEGIQNGTSKLMAAVMRTLPAAGEFIGPGEIASPQALTKHLGQSSSFVSILGEFGITLKQMSDIRAPTHLIGLRRAMLDLYNKSGDGSVLSKSIFADSDKNTKSVKSPSFSMIGESTQHRFYEALDESMISEGLLPRFTLIEYNGLRVPLNKNAMYVKPNTRLIEMTAQMCAQAMMLNGQNKVVNVEFDEQAYAMQDKFDKSCDARINTNRESEVAVQLWNRAHIKSLKLASLIAIGCNLYTPIITAEMYSWAVRICEHDAMTMLKRFQQGEVGAQSEENKQTNDLKRMVKDYMIRPWSEIMKYGSSIGMYNEKILPLSYLSRRLLNMASFKNDRQGPTAALKRVIQSLCDIGDLAEITPQQKNSMGFGQAKCYMITNVHSFNL